MKKSIIMSIFLMFLFMFTLCSCGDEVKTIEKISNNEIIATGEFEEGTILKANKISVGSDEFKELQNRVDLKQFDGINLVIYDFSLEKNGETQEAKKDVTITLPKPFMSPDGFETYHIKKDNSIEKLETKTKGGNISFTTSSFSTFIITGKAPIVNPTNNFLAYADTETQGKIIVNKEEKVAYAAKLEKGDEVFLTAIPNEGYEFVGWFKGSKLSGSTERYDEFKDEAFITFDGGSFEIYARFMPIEYKITYELNGGTFNEEVVSSYNVESNDIILPTPEKEYYHFDGWQSNNNIVTKITKGTTGDITLKATWIQTEGLERTIEITKDVIGEVELGTKNILLNTDYKVVQNGTSINGDALKEEDGIVTIEYKLKSASDEAYSVSIPSEVGEYVVRVRISKSTTDPYYNAAVSTPLEFTMVSRVIKTKFNCLGNYWYDKYTVRDNKIVQAHLNGENILELRDIIGGEKTIDGFENTRLLLANYLFEEKYVKYTEVRIGSKDGVAIARFEVFGMRHITAKEYDENGKYMGQHPEYFGINKYGEIKNPLFSEVSFDLIPNVEGYTDSEGKWICEEKTIDVYTFSHFLDDNPKQTGLYFEVCFDSSRYNNYKDDPVFNQYSTVQNDATNNIESVFYRFSPYNNLKYDVVISGDVEIYSVTEKDRVYKKIAKEDFMTIIYNTEYDAYTDAITYIFVLKPGARVSVYNGKIFKVDK